MTNIDAQFKMQSDDTIFDSLFCYRVHLIRSVSGGMRWKFKLCEWTRAGH